MRAGKELDALVAERVMGWQFAAPRHGWCCTCQHCGRALDECGDGCNYSTDIAAAWMAVEEMRRRGYRLSLTDQPGTSIKIAAFFNDEEYGASIGETTEPHAICKAALAALGSGPL